MSIVRFSIWMAQKMAPDHHCLVTHYRTHWSHVTRSAHTHTYMYTFHINYYITDGHFGMGMCLANVSFWNRNTNVKLIKFCYRPDDDTETRISLLLSLFETHTYQNSFRHSWLHCNGMKDRSNSSENGNIPWQTNSAVEYDKTGAMNIRNQHYKVDLFLFDVLISRI